MNRWTNIFTYPMAAIIQETKENFESEYPKENLINARENDSIRLQRKTDQGELNI